jgi:hypothetical protein
VRAAWFDDGSAWCTAEVPFCDEGARVVRRVREVRVRWRRVLTIEECRGSMRVRRGAGHYWRVR